jgi:cobaltochelatase CobT
LSAPTNSPSFSDRQRQQKTEAVCAAVARAITGDGALNYRSAQLHRSGQRLPHYAPHLHPQHETDGFESFRGASDALSMRLLASSDSVHHALAPTQAIERSLFEMFEQFRCESQVDVQAFPGVRHNMSARFEAWVQAFLRSGITETSHGLLLFTIVQIVRSRLTGDPPLEHNEDLIEGTRAGIVPEIGGILLSMRKTRVVQSEFAVHARALARWVAQRMEEANEAQDAQDSNRKQALTQFSRKYSFGLASDTNIERQATDGGEAGAGVDARVAGTVVANYRAYTTQFDAQIDGQSAVRAELLKEYRDTIFKAQPQSVSVQRLAAQWRALLSEPSDSEWFGGYEEGVIDGRRLAQVVASPAEKRVFRERAHCAAMDASVTFLVDCSGSMRAHIKSICVMIDLLARALHLVGASSEVLGFTTAAWNGGKAHKQWVRDGKPAKPGRLNETLHIVYKAANQPYPQARLGIAAMLKEELFREGVDGEALQWAAQRALSVGASRRLLIVISDGCPMDRATELANEPHYLDSHLRAVVERIERAGAVELFGVGVGLDLHPYYPHSCIVDLNAGLAPRVFRDVMGLIAQASARRNRTQRGMR